MSGAGWSRGTRGARAMRWGPPRGVSAQQLLVGLRSGPLSLPPMRQPLPLPLPLVGQALTFTLPLVRLDLVCPHHLLEHRQAQLCMSCGSGPCLHLDLSKRPTHPASRPNLDLYILLYIVWGICNFSPVSCQHSLNTTGQFHFPACISVPELWSGLARTPASLTNIVSGCST